MISLWWLFLIVPASALFGLMAAAVISANNFTDLHSRIKILEDENKELWHQNAILMEKANGR